MEAVLLFQKDRPESRRCGLDHFLRRKLIPDPDFTVVDAYVDFHAGQLHKSIPIGSQRLLLYSAGPDHECFQPALVLLVKGLCLIASHASPSHQIPSSMTRLLVHIHPIRLAELPTRRSRNWSRGLPGSGTVSSYPAGSPPQVAESSDSSPLLNADPEVRADHLACVCRALPALLARPAVQVRIPVLLARRPLRGQGPLEIGPLTGDNPRRPVEGSLVPHMRHHSGRRVRALEQTPRVAPSGPALPRRARSTASAEPPAPFRPLPSSPASHAHCSRVGTVRRGSTAVRAGPSSLQETHHRRHHRYRPARPHNIRIIGVYLRTGETVRLRCQRTALTSSA